MQVNAKKLAVVGVLVALVAAFFAFDLGQYFTLEYIKSSQAEFRALYEQNTFTVLAVFFLIYVVVTAASLPGAAIMTLLAGALFGLWVGLIVVSFASSIGATLAAFVARFVLRDSIQNKFGDKLGKFNEGIEREGAFYLFTLRLVPIFPFFLINLVMGLTKMGLGTFYWVSQLGMLPGTVVYVNAGKELGKIEQLGDIASPGLILSFVALGIFPIAAKKTLAWYRKKSGKAEVAG
jgi:uncharacterized membrane protein YdjX (TVP38/TMEM64 family)